MLLGNCRIESETYFLCKLCFAYHLLFVYLCFYFLSWLSWLGGGLRGLIGKLVCKLYIYGLSSLIVYITIEFKALIDCVVCEVNNRLDIHTLSSAPPAPCFQLMDSS